MLMPAALARRLRLRKRRQLPPLQRRRRCCCAEPAHRFEARWALTPPAPQSEVDPILRLLLLLLLLLFLLLLLLLLLLRGFQSRYALTSPFARAFAGSCPQPPKKLFHVPPHHTTTPPPPRAPPARAEVRATKRYKKSCPL